VQFRKGRKDRSFVTVIPREVVSVPA